MELMKQLLGNTESTIVEAAMTPEEQDTKQEIETIAERIKTQMDITSKFIDNFLSELKRHALDEDESFNDHVTKWLSSQHSMPKTGLALIHLALRNYEDDNNERLKSISQIAKDCYDQRVASK